MPASARKITRERLGRLVYGRSDSRFIKLRSKDGGGNAPWLGAFKELLSPDQLASLEDSA